MIDFQEAAQVLTAVALLLLVAHAMGWLFARLRQPRVIGEIIGGLLLGPTFLSYFFPSAMSAVFATTGPGSTVLPILSQVGLVLLMYASGAHLRSFVVRGERKVVVVLALAGIILPFLAGLLIVPVLDTSGLQGPANQRTAFLLVFATAIAIASIPVISRIMMDLGIMETPFARIVIATAVVDDLVLYVVLAVALSLVQTDSGREQGLLALIGLDPAGPWAPTYYVIATISLILLTLLAGPPLLRRALRRQLPLLSRDNGAGIQIIFLLLVTGVSIFLGVNPMFGALAAGMAAGKSSNQAGFGASQSIHRLAQSLFIPLYFALVGFKLDLIHYFEFSFFLAFLAFACAVKALSIYAGARLAGETRAAAVNLAAALNARGGPGIVLASVAFDAKIVSENFFAILVLTAVVTSLLAGSWLGRVVRRGVELRPEERTDVVATLGPAAESDLGSPRINVAEENDSRGPSFG